MKKILLSVGFISVSVLMYTLFLFSTKEIAPPGISIEKSDQGTIVRTVYGDTLITEPVLQELLECPCMQRLKNVHQYGIYYYIKNPLPYSRYEHSVGVFVLLRKYGASLHEQIAGLLHDASHTVFSHVGDFIFRHHSHSNSYQDDIHLWYLSQTEIPALLKKYGIDLAEISHKSGSFKALEQDLPYLCADRLEYNLYGGLLEQKLTSHDIQEILKHLKFEDGKWLFDDSHWAKKVGLASIHLTDSIFGTAWNYVMYHWTAKALRRMVKIGSLTTDEIHFSIDPQVWKKLRDCSDQKVQCHMKRLHGFNKTFCLKDVADQDYDIHITPKYRGVNPLIKTKDGTTHLTELDPHYAQEYNRSKQIHQNGWFIKYQS